MMTGYAYMQHLITMAWSLLSVDLKLVQMEPKKHR